MLSHHYRLRSPRLFRYTLGGKRLGSGPYFTVYGLLKPPNFPAEQLPAFGFVVSKKVDKRATRRNRIKRQLREIVRTHLLPHPQKFPQLKGHRAVVVIVRSKALMASFEELSQSLTQCFEG